MKFFICYKNSIGFTVIISFECSVYRLRRVKGFSRQAKDARQYIPKPPASKCLAASSRFRVGAIPFPCAFCKGEAKFRLILNSLQNSEHGIQNGVPRADIGR
jgi:hypothetical protein